MDLFIRIYRSWQCKWESLSAVLRIWLGIWEGSSMCSNPWAGIWVSWLFYYVNHHESECESCEPWIVLRPAAVPATEPCLPAPPPRHNPNDWYCPWRVFGSLFSLWSIASWNVVRKEIWGQIWEGREQSVLLLTACAAFFFVLLALSVGQSCVSLTSFCYSSDAKMDHSKLDWLLGLLLIPEFCPGGQRQRLTVNTSTLLV